MARVVCQVLAQADQFTLLWSEGEGEAEGEVSFPPYVLTGPQAAELRRLARLAHERLAQLGAEGEAARVGPQLAEIGHALYRVLFQADQPAGATGQEVRDWLRQRTGEGAGGRLDIIGDCLNVPWSIVYDQPPDQAGFAQSGTEGDGWKAFWGRRYTLFGGRRVQLLRGRTLPAKPTVVLAVDPTLRSALPQEEQLRLNNFLDAHAPVLVESKERLAAVFATQEVDLLYVFGRAADGCVSLGADRLTPGDLESLLATESEDAAAGETLLVVNPGYDPQHPSSGDMLSGFERFGNAGVIGAWQPVRGAVANRCGLQLLEQFVYQGKPLAEAWNSVREGYPATLYFACCAPNLQLLAAGDTNITAGAIPVASAAADDQEKYPLPDAPYKVLAPLDADDAALLVGREVDILSVAGILDASAMRVLLVHGMSGAGKSSLLRAGVVPYLEDRAIGYRVLRDRSAEEDARTELHYPVLAVRAGSDLAGQLALALCDFCARPLTYRTPAGKSVVVDLPALLGAAVGRSPPSAADTGIQLGASGATDKTPATGPPDAETLRVALYQDPNRLEHVLGAVTGQLPFELVLLVEQADELFSLLKPGAQGSDLDRNLTLLRTTLAGSARIKWVLSLRTEYVGRLLDGLAPFTDGRRLRTFLTRELTEEQLVEVILQPTSAEPLPSSDEVPLQKYSFQFEEGLAESLAADALKFGGNNQESSLVLVHVLCARLRKLVGARDDKVVRAFDLKAIGGAEKGLYHYVESLLKTTSTSRDKRALTKMILDLFIRQPDGSLTRDLVFQDDVKTQWFGSTPLETLATTASAEGVRLLDVSWMNLGGKEGNYLSLGHDALAPVAAQQAEETTRRNYAWTKVTDTLWITIPLMILLGVFAYTRMLAGWAAQEDVKAADELLKEKDKEFKQLNEVARSFLAAKEGLEWSAYLGQVRAAEQSYLAGDLVQMRQALLAGKPLPNEFREKLIDQRGFEWYYLWGLMRQDRATLLGHRGTVSAVAVTADGLTAASGGTDGSVKVWDVVSGRQLHSLDCQVGDAPATIHGLAFSPDGSMLAIASAMAQLHVLDIQRLALDDTAFVALLTSSAPRQPLFAAGLLMGPTQPKSAIKVRAQSSEKDAAEVLAVAFSPDSKTLATAAKDGSVKLWDVSAEKPTTRLTWTDSKEPVLTLAWSPDGKLLAAAGDDKVVRVWDSAKKDGPLQKLPADAYRVAALAWSADGKTLASGSKTVQGNYRGGVVKLFDTTSWKERSLPQLRVAAVWGLAFAGDSKLAIAGEDNAIRWCDAATGKETQVLHGHLGWVRSLALSRDGQILVSGSFDGTVKLWQPKLLAERDVLHVSSTPVAAVQFSPDDRWLATGSGDGLVELWEVATGSKVKKLDGSHQGAVLALAWGNDGKYLVSGGADGVLTLWDTDPPSPTYGKQLTFVRAHDKDLTCLSLAEKDKKLASGSSDGSVKIWTFKERPFDTAASHPAMAAVGVAAVAGVPEHTVIKTGGGPVLCLALRDDGGLLATGHEDGKVRFWNPATGLAAELPAATVAAHTDRVTALVFWGNQQYLLTGSADRTSKQLEIGTGKEHVLRRGHSGPVTGLAVGKEPRQFVTCSSDGTVKVWDVDVLRQDSRITLAGHQGPLRAVAVSGNRLIIAAGGQEGTVRLWRASPPDSSTKPQMRPPS
jgi:WD40 repeat protein